MRQRRRFALREVLGGEQRVEALERDRPGALSLGCLIVVPARPRLLGVIGVGADAARVEAGNSERVFLARDQFKRSLESADRVRRPPGGEMDRDYRCRRRAKVCRVARAPECASGEARSLERPLELAADACELGATRPAAL